MADRREEFLLRCIGVIRRFTCRFQRLLFPHLLSLTLRHILRRIHDGTHSSFRVSLGHDRRAADPAVFLRPYILPFRQLAIGKGHIGLSLTQRSAQILTAKHTQKFFPVVRMDKVLCISLNACIIRHRPLQYFPHFFKLRNTAESVLFKIRIIRGKKHPPKGTDNIRLFLLFLKPQFFFKLLAGNISPKYIHRHPVPAAGIDYMLLHPLKRLSDDAVLTDLFIIIPCTRSLLIQMFRAHDLPEVLQILRADRRFHHLLEILMIIPTKDLPHLAALVDPDLLALPVLQIDRSHDAVS